MITRGDRIYYLLNLNHWNHYEIKNRTMEASHLRILFVKVGGGGGIVCSSVLLLSYDISMFHHNILLFYIFSYGKIISTKAIIDQATTKCKGNVYIVSDWTHRVYSVCYIIITLILHSLSISYLFWCVVYLLYTGI